MAEAVEGLLLSCEGLLTQSGVDKAPAAADCTAQVRAACRAAGDADASLLTAAASVCVCVRSLQVSLQWQVEKLVHSSETLLQTVSRWL